MQASSPLPMDLRYLASCQLPTKFGQFELHAFQEQSQVDGSISTLEHLAISHGNFRESDPLLTRVHSRCVTGEALFSQRCDCGAQLKMAMRAIVKNGAGLILYLDQEGRGIGISNKIRAYALQDQGADTVAANINLGFAPDQRDYSICGKLIEHLQLHSKRWRLMTNNPNKLSAISKLGIEIVERVPLVTEATTENHKYLETKANKLGHLFP